MKKILYGILTALIISTFDSKTMHSLIDLTPMDSSIDPAFAHCIRDCIVNESMNYFFPNHPILILLLHLYSKGLFNLEIFNPCLPKHWKALSPEEQNKLTNKIQKICSDDLNVMIGRSMGDLATIPIQEEAEDQRDQRFADFVSDLNDEARDAILTNGIQVYRRDLPNYINLENLYPHFVDRNVLESYSIENIRNGIRQDYIAQLFIQEHIINAILAEKEKEALETMMYELMTTQGRRNVSFASTMSNLLNLQWPEPKAQDTQFIPDPNFILQPRPDDEPTNAPAVAKSPVASPAKTILLAPKYKTVTDEPKAAKITVLPAKTFIAVPKIVAKAMPAKAIPVEHPNNFGVNPLQLKRAVEIAQKLREYLENQPKQIVKGRRVTFVD